MIYIGCLLQQLPTEENVLVICLCVKNIYILCLFFSSVSALRGNFFWISCVQKIYILCLVFSQNLSVRNLFPQDPFARQNVLLPAHLARIIFLQHRFLRSPNLSANGSFCSPKFSAPSALRSPKLSAGSSLCSQNLSAGGSLRSLDFLSSVKCSPLTLLFCTYGVNLK